MILGALSRYYERAQNDPDLNLAPLGYEWKAIPFVLVIAADGTLRRIEDTRDPSDKKSRGRMFLVPILLGQKGNGIKANLLWETAEYVLGLAKEGSKRSRVAAQHNAFLARIRLLPDGDKGVDAVKRFFVEFDLRSLQSSCIWQPAISGGLNLAFQLEDDDPQRLVCRREHVRSFLERAELSEECEQCFCPVSAEALPIALKHPAIKGVWGGKSSGGLLVSFNERAYDSFGKSQGTNSPVSKRAAFNYTTALNHLLRSGSNNRLQVGDASTVFWASESNTFEPLFPLFFSDPQKDSPDSGISAVRELLKAVDSGSYRAAQAGFYVLGLAPNAARISVRFWVQTTVPEMAARIAQHFKDIAIDRPSFKSEALPLWKLLASTAVKRKDKKIILPPALAGETMRRILLGLPYPQSLLSAAIKQSRVDACKSRKDSDKNSFERAALIKACLTRAFRTTQSNQEMSMSLEPERPEAAYQIGRLFAALERVQSIAQGNINSSIRERYYGAASSTPALVFPTLMKLQVHHLKKINSPGRKVWATRLLAEIVSRFSDFPRQLTLQNQGLFAIGYYHQTQAFFTKSTEPTEQ